MMKQHEAVQPPCSFPWLDRRPGLRRWFAGWLLANWRHLYWESVSQLHTKTGWATEGRLEKRLEKIFPKLGRRTTAEQFAMVDAAARKLCFQTTPERLERELRSFLVAHGEERKHSAAFKASPWCNDLAVQRQMSQEIRTMVPAWAYKGDPDARMALLRVALEFGSAEISHGNPGLSEILAAQEALCGFQRAASSVQVQSLPAFRRIRPQVQRCLVELQREIKRHADEPRAWAPSLRERRVQRLLVLSVRRLCEPKDGPKKLARFIQRVLQAWPQVPAGMYCDPAQVFSRTQREQLVRDHLRLQPGQSSKEFRAISRAFRALLFRTELRNSLLLLAQKARQQADERRKGWAKLTKALEAVLNHLGQEVPDEARFRDFERVHFPAMRNLTRAQRKRLLPEAGNDPDPNSRDLTNPERMILFEKHGGKTRTPFEFDAEGKNSTSTRYRRAAKDVKRELGQG